MKLKLAVLTLFCASLYYFLHKKPPQPPLFQNSTPIEKSGFLDKINSTNQQIRSISGKLDIKSNKIHLSGDLAYQKPLFFRLKIGSEVDIGSNETYFWFYSKRYKKELLYCEHKKLSSARLKPVFTPSWLLFSLGFDELNPQKILQSENYVICIDKNIAVLIKNDKIDSFYLYNKKIIASNEILKNENFPTSWRLNWLEENISAEITLLNPKINEAISPSLWEMPNKKKIDMTTD